MQYRDEYFEAGHYAGGRNTIEGVSHQNGTVRFGTAPTTSALDINCKMHDLANALRVADQIHMRLSA